MMKKIILYGGLLLATCTPLAIQGENVSLPSDSLLMVWEDSTSLLVRFPVSTDGVELTTNDRLVITPSLQGADGEVKHLPVIEIAGKQSRKYFDRQAALQGDVRHKVFPAGEEVVYSDTVRVESWMRHTDLTLMLNRGFEDCCCLTELPGETLGITRYYIPVVSELVPRISVAEQLAPTEPILHPMSAYTPLDSAVPLQSFKEAEFVYFPVDRWEVKADFRHNHVALDRVLNILKTIEPDDLSRVVRVVIAGSASPDGPVKANRELAANRAEALREYLHKQGVNLPDSVYELVNFGEAWADLREVAVASTVPDKEELIRIIDTENDVNRRERRIKRLNGGRTYQYLRDELLKEQRNSGYMEIYFEAQPDWPAIQINRAVGLIGQQRYAEALILVENLDDERKWNVYGAALYMTGQKEKALRCFERAAGKGDAQAAENFEMLNN